MPITFDEIRKHNNGAQFYAADLRVRRGLHSSWEEYH